ncbi:MAG: RluA family pseudouridine synthase [Acidobacteriota bacterium]|nr:MAG: RluA family pseudouridine synthase [Acidobacteriota bacterium]
MSQSPEKFEFTVSPDVEGVRFDVFLSSKFEDRSRSSLKKLIDEGAAMVDGGHVKSSYKLRAGEKVSVEIGASDDDRFEPENIPLDIVFEDEYLAVINKPAGMVVHPGAGVSGGTLANAVAYHFGLSAESTDQKKNNRVGIVHRLDRETSGLIVVAKNEITQDRLSEQFASRKVSKSYVALVHGFVRRLNGKIDAPIARARKNRVKMAVDKNGRNALTFYKVRQRFERFTLLDLDIRTGRTHQIRVHTAYIKHPVVGDTVYNEGRDNTIPDPQVKKAVRELGRFFLHSEKLEITHPVTKERMSFEAPLPEELVGLLTMIREKAL